MRAKSILISVIGLLLLTVLAACGQNTETNSMKKETPTTTDLTAVAEKRKVETVNGEVTIPANPQRIVATYYIGELAALGMKPVGTVTRQLGDNNPNLAAYTSGVADIGATPNLEAIAALEPDLIIATDFDQIEYADYAKIAPTIVVPWSSDDWQSKLRTFGVLLNKEESAEQYIKKTEEKAVQARAAIKDYMSESETVSIIRFFGKSIRVYGGRDIGHSIYNGLQLTPPALIKEAMQKDRNFTSTQDISLEEISEYAADRIFVVVTDDDGDRAYDELQKLSIWSNLSAVKNKKVYKIPADKWFTYDPVSINVTIDEAVRILTQETTK